MSIVSEIQNLSPTAILDLYELDLTNLGDSIYRFHNGTNGISENITWQGNTYVAFPFEVKGYQVNKKGELPRPTLRASNILGTISNLLRSFDDLIGAKVVRKRTFLKYLDGENFPSTQMLWSDSDDVSWADDDLLEWGGTNPDADPTCEFVNEVYYIDRKVAETPELVELELTAPWDIQGVKLPARQIIQNSCPWVYRGIECGYSGPDVADINNVEVGNPSYNGVDACAKNVRACEFRFNVNGILPFGGFPGAGKLR